MVYFSDAQDGVYKIETNTAINLTKVYCQMTSLHGCSGGGWTMVMKINGTKVHIPFNYGIFNSYIESSIIASLIMASLIMACIFK